LDLIQVDNVVFLVFVIFAAAEGSLEVADADPWSSSQANKYNASFSLISARFPLSLHPQVCSYLKTADIGSTLFEYRKLNRAWGRRMIFPEVAYQLCMFALTTSKHHSKSSFDN
jgi:hypothetical protein